MSKKRKSRRKTKFFIGLLLVLGAAGGGGAFFNQGKDEGTAVTTEKAERRTITAVVSATGKVFPEIEVKISSEVAGEIVELPVKEGQAVAKGDLLLKVKPDVYEAQVRQREAAINAAKARSLQAKAEMLQSDLDLARLEQLLAKEMIAPTEVETARTRNEVTELVFKSTEFEITQQEMLLDQANEQLDKTVTYAPMDGTISLLASEVGERVVGTGQFAGTEIMRVADLANMEVRIQVNENDIVNVEIGDPVEVTLEAYPDKKLDGTVTEIANSAQTSGARTQEEITTFEVRIKIIDLQVQIRPGMTATAEIQTETVEEVIAVPIQSVTVREREEVEDALSGKSPGDGEGQEKDAETAGGEGDTPAEAEAEKEKAGGDEDEEDDLQRIVFVVVDGKAHYRAVETGIADSGHIEIVDGLEEGEEVVTGSYSAISRELKHESPVRVREKLGGEDGDGP